jgi:hypothetical protein
MNICNFVFKKNGIINHHNSQDGKNIIASNNNQSAKCQESFEEAPLWAAIVTIKFYYFSL